jgi:hypothetical protein
MIRISSIHTAINIDNSFMLVNINSASAEGSNEGTDYITVRGTFEYCIKP